MKAIFCTPCLTRPMRPLLDALEREVPLLDKAGIEHGTLYEVGCPYISHARAEMLRKCMDASADVVVFMDYDISWKAGDLLKLVQSEGDVVAGTYRFKNAAEEEYMGKIFTREDGRPAYLRSDGAIKASCVPAGFLKVTKEAVNKFMTGYPDLCYGPKYRPHVDMFNHGAFGGLWFGEDYAFCRNWNDIGGEIWLLPDLTISHWQKGDKANDEPEYSEFVGNFHEFLMRQPGGAKDPNRKAN